MACAAGAAQATDLCTATSRSTPTVRALVLAHVAEGEHSAFGLQALDAEGRLVQAGDSEAEATRRPAPWQRVLGYWRAVDPAGGLPSQVRFGALRPAYRSLLHQALFQASSERLQGLGVGPGEGLSPAELQAVQAAVDRVAVIDTPWSAAFVSWLAREAGLTGSEFAFSEAHADYAGAAWRATVDEAAGRATPYALRACNLTITTPRVGDLVCQARGVDAGLDTFDKIGAVLATRPTGGAALPMHCDAVVAVDGEGFDTVGGNVLQSVTRRRLMFQPGTSWLDPSYLPDGCAAGLPGCIDRHMSRQPWSMLLQWR